MARVFLDTNFYIDAIFRNPEINKQFEGHEICYSPLSTHILFYAIKIKVPYKHIGKILNKFEAVDLTSAILGKALTGPTKDLEDNIQLHSAANFECDYFLTNDKILLKMRFFGKVQILNSTAFYQKISEAKF